MIIEWGDHTGRDRQDMDRSMSRRAIRAVRPGQVAQARLVLRECFPAADLAGLHMFAEGWDNTIWEANGFLFRIPKRKSADSQARKEVTLLPYLAQEGLPVPRPVYVHLGNDAVPYTVFGYPRIPGTSLADSAQDEWPEAIYQGVSAFLSLLHNLDLTAVARLGVPAYSPARWRPRYERLLSRVQKKVLPLLGRPASRLEACFREYLDDPRSLVFRPSLIHGDLGLEHLLAEEGSLTGVVDFADACVGDTAMDFAGMPPTVAERVYVQYSAYAQHSTTAGQDQNILTRAQFYRMIAPCYALLYPAAAGPGEVTRAVNLLKYPG